MIGRPLGTSLQKPDPSFVSISSIIASLTFGRDNKSYFRYFGCPSFSCVRAPLLAKNKHSQRWARFIPAVHVLAVTLDGQACREAEP
jgi:hypothetical protein